MTVGAGGAGATSDGTVGSQGTNTTAFGVTVYGGGTTYGSVSSVATGGSGGGGDCATGRPGGATQTATGPSSIGSFVSFGNAGGTTSDATNYAASGGGGAGAVGGDALGNSGAGAGGVGKDTWSEWLAACGIGEGDTSNKYWIGGGGGGSSNESSSVRKAGAGGLGGGGKGGVSTVTSASRTEPMFAGLGTSGIPYSGGGGGGGVMKDGSWTGTGYVGFGPAGSGGSGVIIIKQYGVATAPTIPSSPSDGIAGLVVWLDGSDPNGDGSEPTDSAGISSWVDKTGNAHSATPIGTQAKFRRKGNVGGIKNTLGTMFFSNTRYTLPYTNFPRSHTIICLFRVERALVSGGTLQGIGDDCSCYVLGGSADCLLYFGAVNGYYTAGVGGGLSAASPWGSGMHRPTPDTLIRSQWVIGTMTYDGTSKTTNRFLNGIQLSYSVDTVQQPLFSGLVIGGPSSADYRFNGYIGEILIYSSVLSSVDRKKVEAYVSAKYGFGVGV